MKSRILNIGMLVAFLSVGPVLAGDEGTQSPFSFGAGAADLAQGGANLAGSQTWTAPFWSPARLARAEQFSLGGFHSRLYDEEVAYQYLGLVFPTLDWGSFGIGVFRLSIDGIEKIDVNNFYVEDIQDNRLAFYLAYSRTISNYDFGLAVNLEHHSLDSYNTTSSPGLSLSVGRVLTFDHNRFKELAIVFNGRNLLRPNLKMLEESIDYPYTVDLGTSFKFRPQPGWNHLVTVSTSLTKVEQLDPRLALGLEYNFQNLLCLRGGLREKKLAFGAGITYKAITFDYALVDRDLGSLHMFSLTTAFGLGKTEKKARRTQKQEAEFNDLMNRQIQQQNHNMVTDLVQQGDRLFDSGDLTGASHCYDRALFLARSNRVDTVAIYGKAVEVQQQLENILHMQQYNRFMDSAQLKFDSDDFIAARYFANLALTEIPNSAQAESLLKQADGNIQKASSREELVQERLWQLDSLLSIGQIDRAVTAVRTLVEFAPEHSGVRLASKRVEFERLRNVAMTAYAREDLPVTLAVLDSALALFPGHQWWLDFHARIEKDMTKRKKEIIVEATPAPAITLSGEIKKEVDEAYWTAQSHFKKGDLKEAIQYWEKVERLAPDYLSVREYLVNAYKFVGVELYSQNQLQEAINVWRQAARLDPDNEEITKYINRTENEIRKLEELSYESN